MAGLAVSYMVGEYANALQKLDDQTLETTLVELEFINSFRSLTYTPLKSTNQESLTPNNVLL